MWKWAFVHTNSLRLLRPTTWAHNLRPNLLKILLKWPRKYFQKFGDFCLRRKFPRGSPFSRSSSIVCIVLLPRMTDGILSNLLASALKKVGSGGKILHRINNALIKTSSGEKWAPLKKMSHLKEVTKLSGSIFYWFILGSLDYIYIQSIHAYNEVHLGSFLLIFATDKRKLDFGLIASCVYMLLQIMSLPIFLLLPIWGGVRQSFESPFWRIFKYFRLFLM